MPTSRVSWRSLATILLLAGWLTSCSSTPTTPAIDLSGEPWKLRQGQAVWRPPRGQSEIAGELVIGARGGLDRLVEFSKTPFPLVVAKSTAAGWEIQFGSDKRRFSGRGAPPKRWIWFYLQDCVESRRAPPPGWSLQWSQPGHWRLENRASGESLEGYLKSSAE